MVFILIENILLYVINKNKSCIFKLLKTIYSENVFKNLI